MRSEADEVDYSPNDSQNNDVPVLTKEEKEQKLNELVASGRRFINVGEFENATEVLSDAAELSSELYGENHENTFDSIYYYAMATFEYGKRESQLLASQNKQESEESGDAEEGESKDVADKKADGDNEDPSEEKEDGEEDDDNEDDDDSMKLAWELLETSRCIAAAKVEQLEQENASDEEITEWQLKKADVLVLLGEHGLADGKYIDAQEDLVRGLEIQKAFIPSPNTSRTIAQTYMLIANACGFDARFDESISYYQKTDEILKARVRELQGKLNEETDKNEQGTIEEELKDLETMIPEINTMISDAANAAAQADEVKKQLKAQFEGITSVLAKLPQENETEANDISSMIRRPVKRATTESDANGDDSKKSKEEGTSQL